MPLEIWIFIGGGCYRRRHFRSNLTKFESLFFYSSPDVLLFVVSSGAEIDLATFLSEYFVVAIPLSSTYKLTHCFYSKTARGIREKRLPRHFITNFCVVHYPDNLTRVGEKGEGAIITHTSNCSSFFETLFPLSPNKNRKRWKNNEKSLSSILTFRTIFQLKIISF